jgi:hypothetical protein
VAHVRQAPAGEAQRGATRWRGAAMRCDPRRPGLLVKTKLPKAEFLPVRITVQLRACPPVLAAHVTGAAAPSDLVLYVSIPLPVSRALQQLNCSS